MHSHITSLMPEMTKEVGCSWNGAVNRILCMARCSKYKNITLSDLLVDPSKYLLPKTTARITLDIDISYEEANFIKDTFIEAYDLRDISLQPMKNTQHEEDTGAELHFETIDEIVISQLNSIDDGGSFNKKILVELYQNL